MFHASSWIPLPPENFGIFEPFLSWIFLESLRKNFKIYLYISSFTFLKYCIFQAVSCNFSGLSAAGSGEETSDENESVAQLTFISDPVAEISYGEEYSGSSRFCVG